MGNYAAMTAGISGGSTSDSFGNGYFLKTYSSNNQVVVGVSQGHPDNPLVWFTVIAN
jgi:hypothetical protein